MNCTKQKKKKFNNSIHNNKSGLYLTKFPSFLLSIETSFCSSSPSRSLSRIRLFATLWTIAQQASLSMGFPKQEYWSGLPFSSPGDLPDPGIKPRSPAGSLLHCRQIFFFYQLSHQGRLRQIQLISVIQL